MQSRLIVKNFGPIKFVDLDLRNVNVFIGPQASGKSALAKLYTIFKAPRKFLKNGNSEKNIKAFKEVLEEYNITSFLTSDTEIKFESELHDSSYVKGEIKYDPKLKRNIEEISALNEKFKNAESLDYIVKNKIQKILERYDSVSPKWYSINITDKHEIKYEQFCKIIESANKIEEYLSTQASIYISAERSFINIIKNFSLNLLLNNVPIPKHILLLGSEIEKANVAEIDLNFLDQNLVYKNINGEGRIFIDSDNSIKLIEASSGIQSSIYILIPILAYSKAPFQRSFVIEEPELNLFPEAQYELIKLLESLRKESYSKDMGSIHMYTTHSPYILSAFNNLLYASKIWNKTGSIASANHIPGIEEKLKTIIPVNSNIQPGIFSAYQIKGGNAESILDRETGLIMDNYIDEASDKINEDFEALMELTK